jgi:predicted molibdopterin-dependent oxidoreductase YjgC
LGGTPAAAESCTVRTLNGVKMRRPHRAGSVAALLASGLLCHIAHAAVTSNIVINLPNGEGCYVKDSGGAAELPGPNIWVGSSDFVWTDQ